MNERPPVFAPRRRGPRRAVVLGTVLALLVAGIVAPAPARDWSGPHWSEPQEVRTAVQSPEEPISLETEPAEEPAGSAEGSAEDAGREGPVPGTYEAPRRPPRLTEPERKVLRQSFEITDKALEAWGRVEDPETLRRVAEIGYRVARHSGYDELPLTFWVVDMPVPNALALPGGQIMVTRGMLDLGLSDDMLAALLGHEIAHVALDHHAQRDRRAALLNALTTALVAGVVIGTSSRDDRYDVPYRSRSPLDPLNDEPTQGQVVMGAAAASVVLGEVLLRGFSRDHEDEADESGQRWAAAAGFDPGATQDLFDLMGSRLPQVKQYGYLQTHPYLDDRARAADIRGRALAAQEPRDWDAYRQLTQARLLAFLDAESELEDSVETVVEEAALTAWPRGARADMLRLEHLADRRDETLEVVPLSRDYGRLIEVYRAEREEVRVLDPDSGLLATLDEEIAALEERRDALYPQAREVLTDGVYETAFLERFLSNFPDAPEVPRVALVLGDAYSRRGQPSKAVEQYLAAWRAGPATEQGQRALGGLEVLTPQLEDLAALQRLADQDDAPELARAAAGRLASVVDSFDRLANGADYLDRYPRGPHAETVTARLDALAEKLYKEVVLYQAVGETLQALERIQEILTHAPLSDAATRLREQAVLGEDEAG